MFIASGLRLQHLDMNPVNYKMCIEIQQRVCLRKIHYVNGQTYDTAGMVEQCIINTVMLQKSGVNVSEYVCSCAKRLSYHSV